MLIYSCVIHAFALLLAVVCSRRKVYASALLRAADHPSGRGSTRCCYTAHICFRLAAHDRYTAVSVVCSILQRIRFCFAARG